MEIDQVLELKDGELAVKASQSNSDLVDNKIITEDSTVDKGLSPQLIKKQKTQILLGNSSEHSIISNLRSEEGTITPRRFSPRLKNLPESGKTVDPKSDFITNPDASSDITGNSDSQIEQNGVISRLRSENNLQGSGKSMKNCSVGKKEAYKRVKETIRIYNTYYQQFLQEEENEVKELENKAQSNSNGVKRKRQDSLETRAIGSYQPDLKALKKMSETNNVMYPIQRFGNLPGIDVGYVFQTRAEMVALGFHSLLNQKTDYMDKSFKKMEEYKGVKFPLAVAMVLSDEHDEDQDYSEDIICTSERGSDKNQVVSSFNTALKNNLEQSIPVRVARGQKSDKSLHHKVYTYDGLFEVYDCSIQKGISGVIVYKYRLRRIQGQPKIITKQVKLTKQKKQDIPTKFPGLVCLDISGGQEEMCIPAINFVDDAPFPSSTEFTYSKNIQVAENVELPVTSEGCGCKGATCTNPKSCACAKLNGVKFPYVRRDGGRLLKAKDVVFECGPNCGCGPGCINRISQRPKRFHLEVFRTPDRGWAVRTKDFIPSGAAVCEYVGVLRKTVDADKEDDNDYVFEIDCLHTIKGVDGREKRLGNVPGSIKSDLEKIDDEVLESSPEFCIDAGSIGNIARFVNHSCEPNLFVQCVISGHRDFRLARIVLFASENITPLQEITYDYGYALDSVVGSDGEIKQQPCHCGTPVCRKRLY